MNLAESFAGKRVWVTGHTGFKGAWLCEWLLALRAEVHGFALPPPTAPALFDQLGLAGRIHGHIVGDVRDLKVVRDAMQRAAPDYIFHLAAQPLVRLSYAEPVATIATNVMGTTHVLEAVRELQLRCVVVVVTTDKCYENREWVHGYREEDALGGYDPYSASKAAAEIVTAAYRRSFFLSGFPAAVASARAGNVIGGGDWAVDRIVPDCMRALARGEPVAMRNPSATRPWQHVLEPLGGYLHLAARLAEARQRGNAAALATLCGAFNFGPSLQANRTVRELVEEVLLHWRGICVDQSNASAPHEAGRLMLTVDKAFHLLGWRPQWEFSETVRQTAAWYQFARDHPGEIAAFTRQQIRDFSLQAAPAPMPAIIGS